MEDEIRNLDENETKKLLLAFLLTDGSVRKAKTRKKIQMTLHGKDKCIHDLFVATMKRAFERNPCAYMYNGNRYFRTTFEFSSNSKDIEELFDLTPSFKTKGNPTINSFSNASESLKELGLRIAFSTDGNISFSKGKARLKLGCSNPVLTNEWQKLIKEFGIDMNVCKDKNTWSGIQGLTTDKKKNIKIFHKLGGFVPGCKAYKSKKFPSWEKNEILNHVLDNSCQMGG